MNDWTKDENGEYVRWNQPPHYVNGLLNLNLPSDEGELSPAEFRKRLGEYMKLSQRDRKARPRNPGAGIRPRGPTYI